MLYVIMLMSLASAQIRVAVLDTGFDQHLQNQIPLCEGLLKPAQHDKNGHGTNIVGLIQQKAGDTGYCFLIYNVIPGHVKLSIAALRDAIDKKADIINYSGGGALQNKQETLLIKEHLDKGRVFVASAGNTKKNLRPGNCAFYPACVDDRVIVVANDGPESSYGEMVDHVIDGDDQSAYGIKLSGSSQSAAVFTGVYLKLLLFKKRLENNKE